MTTDPEDPVGTAPIPDDLPPAEERDEHLDRVVHLARSFPALADAPHLDPLDLEAFDIWAASCDCTGAAYYAATFILQVASAGHGWRAGTFNAVGAMLSWDEANRIAFRGWAHNPWGGSR